MEEAISAESRSTEVVREGAPAPFVRIFGWVTLAVLAAFMINNVLIVGFDFPAIDTVFSGAGTGAFLSLALYVIAIALAVFYVLRNSGTGLRWEARKISDFNIYLVRAFFFAVLFVGLVDAAIAFMRVERILPLFFDEDTVRAFGRGQWVGPYIHMPLVVLGFIAALFTRTLGFTWLALLIVLAELLIVISRFLFSYEQALMGDLVRYWYAALFLFASAYTLLDEGHVRVDVFYAGFKTKTKGFINAIGSILLGMTTSWVIIAFGFGSKQAIINAPVANFEVTQTGGTGMFVKYQMAAFLGIFAITMLIQFVSYLFEAVADYRGEPGHVEHEPVSH